MERDDQRWTSNVPKLRRRSINTRDRRSPRSGIRRRRRGVWREAVDQSCASKGRLDALCDAMRCPALPCGSRMAPALSVLVDWLAASTCNKTRSNPPDALLDPLLQPQYINSKNESIVKIRRTLLLFSTACHPGSGQVERERTISSRCRKSEWLAAQKAKSIPVCTPQASAVPLQGPGR